MAKDFPSTSKQEDELQETSRGTGFPMRGYWQIPVVTSHLALRVAICTLLLAVPLAIVVVLHYLPEHNPPIIAPAQHFYLVTAAALTALGASIVLAVVGLHGRQTRLFLMTLAFLMIAAAYFVHGLATPGFLVERKHGLELPEHLGLMVGALSFFLATLELPDAIRRCVAKCQPALLVGFVVLLGAFGGLSFAYSDHLPVWPVENSIFSWVTAVAALLLLAFAAYQSLLAYAISRLPMQGGTAIGLILLMEVVLAQELAPDWTLNWWLGHLMLLLALCLALYLAASEYLHGRSLMAVVQELTLEDPAAVLQMSYSQMAVALATAAENRDHYTYEHISRVADLSLRMGWALRLPTTRLRFLAQGAMLHDVGKLKVPDAILLKPSSLTAEEFAEIKQHPIYGHELLNRLGKFSQESVIARHHHEWWDGSGYPDGLKGEQIPLEVRIVAVADTYDALTSRRPYRDAFTPEQALVQVCKEAGTHFDPACVELLLRVIDGPSDGNLSHPSGTGTILGGNGQHSHQSWGRSGSIAFGHRWLGKVAPGLPGLRPRVESSVYHS